MSGRVVVGSLFSGYGGLDLALRDVFAGELAWVADVEEGPRRILEHHFPGVPNLGDVTSVDWESVRPVDVLAGGFPCQDVSHAGRRAGLIRGETRSGLWSSMLKAIEVLRPGLVVVENVRGLLSATADSDVEFCPWCLGDDGSSALRALGAVCGDLADVGYDAAWTTVAAADVGAPHRRERVFILAWPADAEVDAGWIFDRDGGAVADADGDGLESLRGFGAVGRDADRRAGARQDATDAENDGRQYCDAGGPAQERSGPAGAAAPTLLRTPTAHLAVNGGSQHPDKRKAGGHGPTLADEVEHLLPTPRATDGTNGGPGQRGSSGDLMLPSAVTLLPTPAVADVDGGRRSRSGARSGERLLNGLAVEQAFGQYGPAVERWAALTRPAPLPTEPTGKGGAHRLSPLFVEWMMGLPSGWVTDPQIWEGLRFPRSARNRILRALGNGVVPAQAAAAIRALLGVRSRAIAEGVAAS